MFNLTNEATADLFAQGKAPIGANANGTLWFANGVIYSYGVHFPIAVVADDMPNAVYFTKDTYSVTTARQKNLVFRALKRHGVDVIPVDGLKTLAAQKRAVSHRPVTNPRELMAA